MDVKALGPLKRFNTIGLEEQLNLSHALSKPLSGYLGGVDRGGYWVERLAEEWCETFRCRYAIPCNSATSGLLAACMAAGVNHYDEVWTTSYSMSATAACAMVLGAKVRFIDIESIYFQLNPLNLVGVGYAPRALIVANLHGHPAKLAELRQWCDAKDVFMIEDNAQSPFAMENNRYAGTIGHIGVFSLNTHKHIQAGEGGVVVTDRQNLFENCQSAINHGELGRSKKPGLNLRMTELIATVACAQLAKGPSIIADRIALALELTNIAQPIPFLLTPLQRDRCRHVYYMWCAKCDPEKRDRFVKLLNDKNVPIRAGYTTPLPRLFNDSESCPVADDVESKLISFEVCAYDPTGAQMRQMRDIIHWAAEQCNGDDQTKEGGGGDAARGTIDADAQQPHRQSLLPRTRRRNQ